MGIWSRNWLWKQNVCEAFSPPSIHWPIPEIVPMQRNGAFHRWAPSLAADPLLTWLIIKKPKKKSSPKFRNLPKDRQITTGKEICFLIVLSSPNPPDCVANQEKLY